jgi:hypothetical protein
METEVKVQIEQSKLIGNIERKPKAVFVGRRICNDLFTYKSTFVILLTPILAAPLLFHGSSVRRKFCVHLKIGKIVKKFRNYAVPMRSS